MAKGVKKIKYIKGIIYPDMSVPNLKLTIEPNQWVWFMVSEWETGTTEKDKERELTWLWQSTDRKVIISEKKTPATGRYGLKLPKKLCGSYHYYIEASLFGGRDFRRQAGLYVKGYCPTKIVSSKWSKILNGADDRKTYLFSYGENIYLHLATEGLNGDKVSIEIYRQIQRGGGIKDDEFIQNIPNVQVIDGEVNLEIGNTYQWYGKIRFPKNEEKFYIKVKNSNGKYITDGKDSIHARYLRIKNNIISKKINTPSNITSIKVGQIDKNIKRYELCKFEQITIKEKKSTSDFILYDINRQKNIMIYEKLVNATNTEKIDVFFKEITNKGCFNNHKKVVEVYMNNEKLPKIEALKNSKLTIPIKAEINTYLLKTNPELFILTPDKPNVYKIIAKTCAQLNNPFYISIYPNIEREFAFVLTLLPSFSSEINQAYSAREKLTDYNKKQSMQLIRDEVEILYNSKGGLGFGLQAKVKIGGIESSIELSKTKSQIKKLISFYHKVKEKLSVFDGRGKESASIAYQKKILPKTVFDIEPPNVALALRIINKQISNIQKVVPQLIGSIALKPIIKIKFGVDALSLLKFAGVGGKIADWIKDKIEAKFNFTMYVILECFLEAKAEISLTYNEIEGFASDTRKLLVEAGIAIKGGVKSLEYVTVLVPESDNSTQRVKVEKWKGEAVGTSSMVYTYEVNADKKGQYNKHKLECTGIKATIIVYAIKKGMKYNESFRKDFTIYERPEEPIYESEKEYTL